MKKYILDKYILDKLFHYQLRGKTRSICHEFENISISELFLSFYL